VDQKFNNVINDITWEGELDGMVVVRGGRFYDASGKEYETPPAIAEHFVGLEDLPAKDFVLMPVRTAKTVYGFLYLANPWSGRDIDPEGVATLCRDFVSVYRIMRRQKGAAAAGEEPKADRKQLMGILRRVFGEIIDHEAEAAEYLSLINVEAREAKDVTALELIIAGLAKHFNMPKAMIQVEMVGAMTAFLGKDWLGAALEAGVIEVLQAMGITFSSDKPDRNFVNRDFIFLRLEGDTIGIEISQGAMGQGLGMKMLRLLDAELRKQGTGGVRARVEGKKLLVRLQNPQKK
jgi:hypothetical protein